VNAAGFRAWLGRLSTGLKVLIILNLALLPLGLIAVLASLEASRSADADRRADLRIALTESTRKLNVQLAADISAMRVAANAVALGGFPDETCARLQAILSARSNTPTPFALFGVASDPVCATPEFAIARPSTVMLDADPRATMRADTLDIVAPGRAGSAVVVVRYPAAVLRTFAKPFASNGKTGITLADDTAMMVLEPGDVAAPKVETASGSVGILGLTITLTAPTVPLSLAERLLVFLPLMMWLAASAIAFYLVHRLLLRPLRELRLAVDSHIAGQAFAPMLARTPAREIRELGGDIAQALDNQAKATREVHHRVKNNLQIVASLISLHARTAQTTEAAGAYAAIQRRVDALAIVHRNHYAELDTGGGIDLRRLISEIAANLRANTEATGPTPPIAVTAQPASVTQDVAIAIGFLITELIELAAAGDATAPVAIDIHMTGDGKGRITIASNALRKSADFEALLTARYARILEGLGRQLRAPIDHDPAVGRFSAEFAMLEPHARKI
jgi:two-component system, sensor histidine kinase PdtaS